MRMNCELLSQQEYSGNRVYVIIKADEGNVMGLGLPGRVSDIGFGTPSEEARAVSETQC